jgi:hypothetical protein
MDFGSIFFTNKIVRGMVRARCKYAFNPPKIRFRLYMSRVPPLAILAPCLKSVLGTKQNTHRSIISTRGIIGRHLRMSAYLARTSVRARHHGTSTWNPFFGKLKAKRWPQLLANPPKALTIQVNASCHCQGDAHDFFARMANKRLGASHALAGGSEA